MTDFVVGSTSSATPLVGSSGNDSFSFSLNSLLIGLSVDGGSGDNAIVVYDASLTPPSQNTFDLRNVLFKNIDQIEFGTQFIYPGSAALRGGKYEIDLKSSQFGPGLISNSSFILGPIPSLQADKAHLVVTMDASGSFSAANWTFQDWSETYGYEKVYIYGTAGNDTITASSLGSTIDAGAGNDRINVASGTSTLTGGAGADIFAITEILGQDLVTDFSHSEGDRIDLSALTWFHTLADVLAAATQDGANTVISELGAGSLIRAGNLTLAGVQMTSLTASDFILSPGSSAGTGTGTGSGTGTGAGTGSTTLPTVGFTQNAISVPEGNSGTTPVNLTLQLSAPSSTSVTVNYATFQTSPSAVVGVDFTPVISSVTFAPGQIAVAVSVSVIGNKTIEPDKAFIVGITAASGATFAQSGGGSPLSGSATITILNDDGTVVSDLHSSQDLLVYEIYQAAYGRIPDNAGFRYWATVADNNQTSAKSLADSFIAAPEFTQLYGVNPTNLSYVNELYSHVLGRSPDAAGLAYWVAQADAGLPRDALLVAFATSTENVQLVGSHTANGYLTT